MTTQQLITELRHRAAKAGGDAVCAAAADRLADLEFDGFAKDSGIGHLGSLVDELRADNARLRAALRLTECDRVGDVGMCIDAGSCDCAMRELLKEGGT